MLRGLGVLVMCVSALTPARAQCTSSRPSPGLEVQACQQSGLRYHVVRIDLAAGDVGLRVSRPSERAQTIERWVGDIPGAAIALAAGNFEFPSYRPRGLTVGEGEVWSSEDNGLQAVLGFDARGVGVFVPERQVVSFESWMANVVSGVRVLRAGVSVDECAESGCERRSRTGLGLDADARFLIGVVAEGDRAASVGVSDPELGALLRDAGAFNGLRSAEGATSSLWASGALVSASSDGASRPAAVFLAAVDLASGQTTRLRGVVGIEGRPDDPLADSMLTVEALDGRVVASGMPVTDAAYWEFSLPVREYIVRASHPGFRTGCKVCVGEASADVWCSLFLVEGEGEESCAPTPRTLDVGPWPIPEETDAGVPDGGDDAMSDLAGCAAGGAGSGAWLFLLGALWRRR